MPNLQDLPPLPIDTIAVGKATRKRAASLPEVLQMERAVPVPVVIDLSLPPSSMGRASAGNEDYPTPLRPLDVFKTGKIRLNPTRIKEEYISAIGTGEIPADTSFEDYLFGVMAHETQHIKDYTNYPEQFPRAAGVPHFITINQGDWEQKKAKTIPTSPWRLVQEAQEKEAKKLGLATKLPTEKKK